MDLTAQRPNGPVYAVCRYGRNDECATRPCDKSTVGEKKKSEKKRRRRLIPERAIVYVNPSSSQSAMFRAFDGYL